MSRARRGGFMHAISRIEYTVAGQLAQFFAVYFVSQGRERVFLNATSSPWFSILSFSLHRQPACGREETPPARENEQPHRRPLASPHRQPPHVSSSSPP